MDIPEVVAIPIVQTVAVPKVEIPVQVIPPDGNKEVSDMVDSTIPVLPVTHSAGGYGHHSHGLEGKDAAFLSEIQNQISHKDNAIQTLEVKFQAERLGRDMIQTQERLAREHFVEMRTLRDFVLTDGDKTRVMIKENAAAQDGAAMAELRLELALLKQKVGTSVPTV